MGWCRTHSIFLVGAVLLFANVTAPGEQNETAGLAKLTVGIPGKDAKEGSEFLAQVTGGKVKSEAGQQFSSSPFSNLTSPSSAIGAEEPTAPCLLKPVGRHPWLIRITPMTKLPKPPKEPQSIRRRRDSWRVGRQKNNTLNAEDAGMADVDDNYGDLYEIFTNRTRTVNNQAVESVRVLPKVTAEIIVPVGRGKKHPVVDKPKEDDEPETDDNQVSSTDGPHYVAMIKKLKKMKYLSKVDQTSKMHGSLIAPNKVLTTVTYENAWVTNIPLPMKYLSLIGYNEEDNCHQEQWGRTAHFHSKSSLFSVNVGEFAIVYTYADFEVQGDPFLFGLKGIPDFERHLEVYDLLGSGYGSDPGEEKAKLYIFEDRIDKKNGKTYEPSEVAFVPWDACKNEDAMKKINGISPQAKDNTFFCIKANDGWKNVVKEDITNKEEPSIIYDWFQGAPAVFTMNQTMTPLGHYVYRVDGTNQRIFATFTKKIMELLQPDPGTIDYGNELDANEANNGKTAKGRHGHQENVQEKPIATGRKSCSPERLIVGLGTILSSFFTKGNVMKTP